MFTDDWRGYYSVTEDYATHYAVNHSKREYVRGRAHTNTVEGYFGNFKNSIRGTHKHISAKWMQSYLNEHDWRYNHRGEKRPMFFSLLSRATAS